RFAILGLFAALLALCSWTITPRLAHVSENRELNEIATNGYFTFWHALLGTDAPYDGLYASDHSPQANQRLERLLTDSETVPASFEAGTSRRAVRPAGPERKMN